MLNAAVRANTWASPVQPSRSSRWGQSVGTSRKLLRCPQTMFCCSRFKSESDVSRDPVGARSDDTAIPVMVAVSAGAGSRAHVAEAVEGEVRLVALLALTLEGVTIRLGRPAQVGGVQISVPVEHLGV